MLIRRFKVLVKRSYITICSGGVKKFLKLNNDLRVIGVSGSVGKTSTKFALEAVFSDSVNKVLVHEGSYNDPLASLFVLMGLEYPNINNPLSLAKSYFKLRGRSKERIEFDVAILELGTDSPGEMKQFGKFLNLDVCVITAITPEHMQNFKNMEELANEELEVCKYSKKLLVNRDLVDRIYVDKLIKLKADLIFFGTGDNNFCVVKSGKLEGQGLETRRPFEIKLNNEDLILRSKLLHSHSGFSLVAALIVAGEFNLSLSLAAKKLEELVPAKGRGRILKGVNGSFIIDDSYNNVGANVSIAALDLLYEFNSRIKIAVLGGINELGLDLERDAHNEVAAYFKKKKLREIILIGDLAQKYYLPVVENLGIKFSWFGDPYAAGEYLKLNMPKGAAVLVKGSQNGVYSEEVIPYILENEGDVYQLVRQSKKWKRIKGDCFGRSA